MVQQQSMKLQDSCPDVVSKIQAKLGMDIQHDCGMSFSSMMSRYSQTLPSDANLESDALVIDQPSKNALEVTNSINWWSMPCPNFYPLHSPNNKNVARLCSAASISMWGIDDCILADTMRKILNDDEKNGSKLYNRWVAANNLETETDQVKLFGWKNIISAMTDDHLPTDPFHIFLLSNILRRPIIIFSDDNFKGVSFPLLWPESFVMKTPLVLGRTTDFIPLIPHLPESGRDFIPMETADGKSLPLCGLTETEKVRLDELFDRYLDAQLQVGLVNHQILTIRLARLTCIEMTYDMSIIDQYLDGVSGAKVDMETYVLSDRWSQLAIGFPPMDWYLPRQVSLYSFLEDRRPPEQEECNKPDNSEISSSSSSTNERFFKRETIEIPAKKFAEEPSKPEINVKRAMFKRRATLSELGPAFGGRRGIIIGGEAGESSADTSVPVRKTGIVSARPGLGTRVRPQRRKSLPVETISEEGTEDEEALVRKLKEKYNSADHPEQHQGFIGDRSVFRTMMSRRRSSLSETLPQYPPY